MSTQKITIATGHKIAKPANFDSLSLDERATYSATVESFRRPGHVAPEKIAAAAAKKGFVGLVTITHEALDMSGKGRSGAVQQFEIVI